MSQKFRSKNVDETRNFYLEEIKRLCTCLNYIEHFII